MGRKVNIEKLPEWYNPFELKALFLHAGYEDYGEAAAKVLNVSCAKSARRKINNAILSQEDMIALAKFLRMTPREFLQVFYRGVFDDAEPLE